MGDSIDQDGHRRAYGALRDTAQAATARGDWAAGLQAAAKLRAGFPAEAFGYRIGVLCLLRARQFVEAERLVLEAIGRFGQVAWAMADYARMARLQGHWDEAILRWAAFRAAFPDDPEGFVEGAIAARNVGQFDASDSLLRRAMEQFPSHPGILLHYARNAQALADWPEADRRWRAAHDACPDNPQIALSYAEFPARGIFDGRHDWDEAFRRFAELHVRLPDFADAYAAHLAFLCTAKRAAAAPGLAALAREKFPGNLSIALACAQVTEANGDLEAAARAYERAAGAFPHACTAQARLALVLGRLGRPEDADRVCEAAMTRFPGEPEIFCTYAELANARNEWVACIERWRDAARRFPDERRIRARLHQAEMAAATHGDEAANGLLRQGSIEMPRQTLASSASLSPAELISRFESLGGTFQGCEFGLVQRALGAEPVGLLRWASMSFESLHDCLNADFEGVGTPEQTILGFYPARDRHWEESDDPEYLTRDGRFRMGMHTFVKKSQVPFEKMHSLSCRRITFLRRTLMEDLAAGEKIFVFKLGHQTLTGDQIEALHAALRRYGETTLLYVRLADDAHASGSVAQVKPGLLIGYIDHFSMTPEGLALTPNIPAWTSICEQAWRIHAGAGKRAGT